jgi:hypothetical protein
MRRMRWFAMILLCLSGCRSAQPDLKPPLHEEYVLPPSDDPRFSTPPNYPKETLDSAQFQKDALRQPGDPLKGSGGPPNSRFGMGGPGGPGGMGGP